jgi:arylsulfatase B
MREEALVSVADWYATYASLAGVPDSSLVDTRAAAAGLPPLDSVNCWPVIAGMASSCRTEIPFGDTSALGFNMDGDTLVGGLINSEYFKILLGPSNLHWAVGQDVTTGPIWPNVTLSKPPLLIPKQCERTPETGCLFNVKDDPSESNNLAASMPQLFNELLARVDSLQKTVYSPKRGYKNVAACEAAVKNGYYWGTFWPTPTR